MTASPRQVGELWATLVGDVVDQDTIDAIVNRAPELMLYDLGALTLAGLAALDFSHGSRTLALSQWARACLEVSNGRRGGPQQLAAAFEDPIP